MTDGEQRESSFATYNLDRHARRHGAGGDLAGDGQFFAIFDDGHNRQLPRLTRRPVPLPDLRVGVRREEIAHRHASGQAGGDLAVDDDAAVPAGGRDRGFPRDSSSPTASTRRRRTSASASRPAPSRLDRLHRGSPGEQERLAQPLDRQDMLQEFIDLNNRVFARFSPTSARTSGSTRAPAATATRCTARRSLRDPARAHVRHNAGYFLIQCASEDDREAVYEMCGQLQPRGCRRRPQVCFMGVINPLRPEVETAEQVRDELLTAAEHIPIERLGPTDDCGFSPFSRDVKPKHGRPTSPATWRCRRSRRGSRVRGWLRPARPLIASPLLRRARRAGRPLVHGLPALAGGRMPALTGGRSAETRGPRRRARSAATSRSIRQPTGLTSFGTSTARFLDIQDGSFRRGRCRMCSSGQQADPGSPERDPALRDCFQRPIVAEPLIASATIRSLRLTAPG